MRKFNVFFSLAVMLLISQLSFGQVGITGSAHDFSSRTWNPGGEICIVCHTPHTGYGYIADAPLWNHQLTAVNNFLPYASSTLNATVGQPDGTSKLCLSCHDGTIALDNFSGTITGGSYISNINKVGTDLRNDHPISFTYDATLIGADADLKDPATTLSGIPLSSGTIATDMLSGGTKMQCTSCHDVHNGSGLTNLLIKDNAGSALCITCHNK